MEINTTESANVSNVTSNSSEFGLMDQVYTNIFDIMNGVGIFLALVGLLCGCFVINIVRKLDDSKLRSRFSLLCVLVCDVILAFSNLWVFTLSSRRQFSQTTCLFVYVNVIINTLFSMSLVLALLCLAVDQVIAVFKPLYFRVSEGTHRRLIYGAITFIPIPVVLSILIYWTWQATESSEDRIDCRDLMQALTEFVQYLLAFVVSLVVCTPVIYAVVLWKISRTRFCQSENSLENVQNRKLVVSFLLLSASYFLLWMPTLAYFSVCYYNGDDCWTKDAGDVSLIMQVTFLLNYILDPVMCAVRMEPIKQKVIIFFSTG